jgi:hypothetical protein
MKKLVDVDELKKEIIFYMDTGHRADEIICQDLLKCIDRNTHEGDCVIEP